MKTSLRTTTASLLFVAISWTSIFGQAPTWWERRGVLTPGRAVDDFAALNLGQLKALALATHLEMQAVLPGGAGNEANEMISRWLEGEASGTADNHAVATLGQLKETARPFYDRLIFLGMASGYPWAGPADDHAVANIGQAKAVFSFASTGLEAFAEANQPQPPGGGEGGSGTAGGGSGTASTAQPPTVGDDVDEDGWNELKEVAEGTNPNSRDSDGDGVSDPEDAVPYDNAFRHKRTAALKFIPIELSRIDEAQGRLAEVLLGEDGSVAWQISKDGVETIKLIRLNGFTSPNLEPDVFTLDPGIGYINALTDISRHGHLAGAAFFWEVWDEIPQLIFRPWIAQPGGQDLIPIYDPEPEEPFFAGNDMTVTVPSFGLPDDGNIYAWYGYTAASDPLNGKSGLAYTPVSGGNGWQLQRIYEYRGNATTAPDPWDTDWAAWPVGTKKKMGVNTDQSAGDHVSTNHTLFHSEVEITNEWWEKLEHGQEYPSITYEDPDEVRHSLLWRLDGQSIMALSYGTEADWDARTERGHSIWQLGEANPVISALLPWVAMTKEINTGTTESPEWWQWAGIHPFPGTTPPNDGFTPIVEDRWDFQFRNQPELERSITNIGRGNSKGWVEATGRNGRLNKLGLPMPQRRGLWLNGRLHDWSELAQSPNVQRLGEVQDWLFRGMNDMGQVLMEAQRREQDPEEPIGTLQDVSYLLLLCPLEVMGVDEDGDPSLMAGAALPPSAPSPTIEISRMEVTAVRYDPVASKVFGTIRATGTVLSAQCDTLPAADGTITTARLRINGKVDEDITFLLQASKTKGSRVGRPFPYAGSFDRVFANVELSEGVNTLSILAADPVYRIEGHNTWGVNVSLHENDTPVALPNLTQIRVVIDQADGLASFRARLLGGDGGPLMENIFQQHAANGYFLHFRANSSYSSPIISMQRALLDGSAATGRGVFSAGMVLGSWLYRPFDFQRESDGALSASQWLYRAPIPPAGAGLYGAWIAAPSWVQGNLLVTTATADAPHPIDASTGGQHYPFVMRLDVPAALANRMQVQLGQPAPGQPAITATVRLHADGHRYLWRQDGSGPLVATARQKAEPMYASEMGQVPVIPEAQRLQQLRQRLPLSLNDAASFLKGFAAGIGEGGMEIVTGTQQVASATWEYAGLLTLGYYLSAKILIFGAERTQQEQEFLEIVTAEISGTHQQLGQTAGDLASLAWDLLKFAATYQGAELEVVLALLSGSSDEVAVKTARFGELNRQALEFGAEIIGELLADYKADTPEGAGRLLGRALFEITAVLLPFTKAGQAGNLAKLGKLEFLQKLKLRPFFTGSGPGAGAMGRVEAGGLLGKLAVTKMCFVAGTVVWVRGAGATAASKAAGPEGARLVAIEQVSAGMEVWARDEFTGEWGWRRVVETFVTHPAELYRLTYEVRGPPESGNQGGALSPLSAAESGATGSAAASPDGGLGQPSHRDRRSQPALPFTETLGVTGPHPFWVSQRASGRALAPQAPSSKPAGQFLPAEELQPGDVLTLADGGTAEVTGKVLERAPEGQTFTTYNFEVEGYHTYFAGRAGVWVHNAGDAPCQLARSMMEAQYAKHGDIWRAFSEAQSRFSVDDISMRTRLRMFNETRTEYFAGRWGGAAPPWDDVAKQTLQNNKGDSQLLGRNLKAVGIEAPWGDGNGALAAHHIVPHGHQGFPEFDQCRQLLRNAGIDIDEAANGVFLRANANVDMPELGAAHAKVHSQVYARELVTRLRDSTNLRQTLQEIGDELSQGIFPF